MMSRAEADELIEALREIECGHVEQGVLMIRQLLRKAGHPAPPYEVPDWRQRQPRGSER
jgi:hypothetical protein